MKCNKTRMVFYYAAYMFRSLSDDFQPGILTLANHVLYDLDNLFRFLPALGFGFQEHAIVYHKVHKRTVFHFYSRKLLAVYILHKPLLHCLRFKKE